ncbi:DUF202 domain-containing protein [Fulvimonas sp. R45]|jgi:putative membrane protein|uniref:YidH family protein n=1 Tax=Fulvimonas sp. R45 TaxID=3045937 RepID=UPI00265ECC57|nr:DUF202 domain-containing protein [Fulvimonas sp. R45]MDO1527900.1 DUF202 domain-containing protein [Fulvimonas sp. R45]
MIPHFSDLSANERTYLAWIRTAVSLMGFGFLIERFDVFLVYSTRGAVLKTGLHLHASEWLGLGMILLGGVLILLATRDYYRNSRLIRADAEAAYHGTLVERTLTTLLVGLALFLVLYVGYQLASLG